MRNGRRSVLPNEVRRNSHMPVARVHSISECDCAESRKITPSPSATIAGNRFLSLSTAGDIRAQLTLLDLGLGAVGSVGFELGFELREIVVAVELGPIGGV